MISRSADVFTANRWRYNTVDPDEFIERLKRLRAIDPTSSRFGRGYYRSNRASFSGTKMLLKLR